MAFVFTISNAQDLNKTALCKKWYIHHCRYMWKNYDPEANEKNDYILFNDDMTYESVDEGKKSTGKWTFNAKEKYILMANKEGKKIKLEVEELNSKELVFEIDDKDMKGVDLHYSTQKR